MKIFKTYFSLFLILAGIALPLFRVSATTFLLKDVGCAQTNDSTNLANYQNVNPVCTTCDFIQVLVNASNMMVAISGVVAMLMFVYAGILYLTVSAKPDYAAKAKSVMISTVIGIVLVFGGYSIINFVLTAFGGTAGMGAYQDAYYSITGKNEWGVCVEQPEAGGFEPGGSGGWGNPENQIGPDGEQLGV